MSSLHATRKQMLLLFGLSFMLGWMGTSTAAASPVCSIAGMTPARVYAVFDESITTGDFNGDGRPDIAAGSGIGPNGGVSVLLNDGAGGLSAPVFYVTGAIQNDVVTGDFNNDGKLDIATGNYFDNTISLLLGVGDGSFNPPLTMPSGGPRPQYLATGDFNRDGQLDLAVANSPDSGQGNISILLGNGAGGFSITTPISPHTNFMRAADFNRDGNTDVIGVKNQLALFLGNDQGGFSPQINVNPGIPVTSFTIADFNHDQIPDIASVSGSHISIILGNGNGTFTAPVIHQPSVLNVGSFLASGDFNGDGHLDIFSSNEATDGRVYVLTGTGTGIFDLTGNYPSGSSDPGWIASADFNGDGRADVAVRHFINNLSILFSTCLSPTPRYDFDGDGKADIAVYRPSSGIWYTLRSSDNSFNVQPWGISTDRIVPGDYDGDSRTDLAVYRPSEGTWYILRSTNATIKAQQWGTSTDQPVAADYDADGRADLAVYRAGIWYILRSSDNAVNTHSFGISTDQPVPADYDRDGKADIAVYRPSQGMWFIQQSTNNQMRSQLFGSSGDVPVTGDYDGDGRADVAVYRPSSGTWYALRSSNSSLMAQNWGIDTDVPVPADYDGDGKTDVAVYRQNDGTWYIIRSADGSFISQPFGTSTDVPVPSYLAQ